MRRKKFLKLERLAMVAVSIMLAGSMSIKADAAASSKDVSSYTAEQVTEDMKIGWNLGNTLDAINKNKGYYYNTETIWGNPVTTKENIDAIAEAGFGAVRVPVSWYNHIDANGTIDSKWLARVGEVVNYALDNDLYVIINIHHDAGMAQDYNWIYADTDSYETDRENFASLWTQIAAYFKDYDEHLLFEATNEIMNSDRNWDWGVAYKDFRVVHDLDQEFINIVRDSGGKNQNRCLILSTWAASTDSCQIENLFYKGFTDTVEDKLIMSVHNYSQSDSAIEKFMPSLASYSEKYGIPVIIDEFGTKASVALSTREKSAEKYVSTAKEAGIVCFWWDNGGDYMIFNRKTNEFKYPTIVEVMMKAVYGDEIPTKGQQTTEGQQTIEEQQTSEENVTTEEKTNTESNVTTGGDVEAKKDTASAEELETEKKAKEIKTAKAKKGKILKAKNIKTKKIQLKLKKIKGYKYQIKVCTSKKFKKNVKTYKTSKTTYTIKNLKKGKTYYVKVRTYKKINGENVYGKWSTIKKVKIKK